MSRRFFSWGCHLFWSSLFRFNWLYRWFLFNLLPWCFCCFTNYRRLLFNSFWLI